MSQPAIIKVKIRTGTLAEWVNANPILLQGEFGFVTDDKKLIIGDGTNAFLTLYDSFHRYYQIASVEYLEQVTGALQTSLGDEITDRIDADGILQDNIDNIAFDVTTINGTLTSHDTRISAVETLIANFNLTLTAKGQILVLNDIEGKYIPLQVGANGYVLTADDTNSSGISWSAIPNQSIALDDLTDVNLTTLINGDVVTYDSTNDEWTNASVPRNIDDLGDVAIISPANNDVLKYSGGSWINSAPIVYGDMFKSTYDVDNDGIVDSSEKMLIIGRNSTGATLYQGIIVYISGSTGNRPNFVKAQANAESTSAGTFGVIVNDITNNSDGYVCTIGTLHNLDTRINASHPFTDVTLVDGDTIYLHPTIAGYVTNVKPSAPNHLVYIGKVIRTTAQNGTIVYRIQNGYELKEIHDVQANSPANNDTLYYDSSDTQWKTKSINNILGYTPANILNSVASVGASLPIASSGGLNPSISIAQATTSANGYISSTDFNTFNNKFTSFTQFRKSGRWYNNGLFPPANAGFVNQVAIRYVPFFVDADITISRLGINVVTAVALTNTCRLGIYTNDASTCQPLTKIYGTGTLAIDSTGAKNETGLSIALTKGLYWFAYIGSIGGGSITGIGTNAVLDVKGQSVIGAVGFAGFNQTFTYGALPTSAGTLIEVNSGGTICIFYYY
jgi:hypothetical protein